MPTEQERAVVAYFHRMRQEAKHKPSPGVDKIVAALWVRWKEERDQTS